MSQKLESLLKKEQQLKAQIQLAQAAERTKEKKKDTRRKFFIGSAIMSQIEDGKFTTQKLTTMMDTFLTRPNERALFGLSTPEASPPNQKIEKTGTGAKKKATSRKTRSTATTAKKKATAKKTIDTGKATPKS